ncbi:zinc finger BED domain-containing protein 4-like isoform X2 [Zeugodacus cucurbitae]|nr:zinc finger BED domain-containing protein 4-like isoform X2 [Zeugodacus cucurbitae]
MIEMPNCSSKPINESPLSEGPSFSSKKPNESSMIELPSCSNKNPQPLISKVFQNIENFSLHGSKNQKLQHGIVEMVIKDNLPFDFVEGKGFLSFMKQHFPLYKVPTRNTIKAHIEKMYDEEKEKCVAMLKTFSYLSLTIDIWTDVEMNSMLGVTIHGVNGTKQFNGTIGVYKLTETHTASHISEVLIAALKDFSIDEKQVMAVVTDNGANIVKAVHDSFGKKRHIPCFAHTLNLVCENSLNDPEVNAVVVKCKKIVKWLKRSVKANDDLRNMQAAAGVAEGKMLKPILDVKTRWNSTYYMLERFIKLCSYINQILLNYSDAPVMITSKEKDDIIEILSVLRPLEAMTVQLSGEQRATLSQVIPLVHCGREQIVRITAKQPVAEQLKDVVLNQFDRRFGYIEHSFLLAASTLLDPRFKIIHFKDPLALSPVIKFLRTEITVADDTMETGSESSVESVENEFDLWAPHKTLVHKRRRKDNDFTSPQDELSFYLNCQVLELSGNTIDAWEEMKTVYPKLYGLSKKYCHLLGTSVPAERLFSKAGATATEKRNRLTTKRLSKLLFLQTWLNRE